MEPHEIPQQDRRFSRATESELSVDFYRKITEFTRNLTSTQLLLLRDHLDNLPKKLPQPQVQQIQHCNLSKREVEVLILLTNGYNRTDIGHSLGISANTAARHIANIYQKLNISSVAEATHYAINNNIIN